LQVGENGFREEANNTREKGSGREETGGGGKFPNLKKEKRR